MAKPKLFLLAAGFESESGEKQFCPDCMLIEGVLAAFPNETSDIDVVRVAFSKPREALVTLLGEEHQSCPALVREIDGELTLANDIKAILAVLRDDFGVPAARGMI